jgi:hypothetical protein
MSTYNYEKTVYVDKLELEIKANASLKAKYSYISAAPNNTNVVTTSSLTSEEEDALDAIVAAHTASPTTAQSMRAYLDGSIFPFVADLISRFAADNIAMGITQAGKTGAVLGLFVKPFDVNANSLPLSLRDCFDSGSLYEAIKVIQHLRNNPSEFTGLSPYISDDRLHTMKNEIEAKLGIPLT